MSVVFANFATSMLQGLHRNTRQHESGQPIQPNLKRALRTEILDSLVMRRVDIARTIAVACGVSCACDTKSGCDSATAR
jgi:hypothetical protein